MPFFINHQYIKTASLTIQRIESYRPVFMIKITYWYTHKLEISTSNTVSLKVETEISVKSGSCEIYGGYSVTTCSSTAAGWSETATNGQTKVVYVRMVFLRVYGTVTYNLYPWGTETREYDATILESVDYMNRITKVLDATYNEIPVSSPIYYDNPNDGNTEPDKFYYMGDMYFSYSSATTQSSFIGIKLKTENDIISIVGSAKFTWTTSTSVTIRHTFQGPVPDNLNYFYISIDNFFSVNIMPYYTTGGGGNEELLP